MTDQLDRDFENLNFIQDILAYVQWSCQQDIDPPGLILANVCHDLAQLRDRLAGVPDETALPRTKGFAAEMTQPTR